MKKRNLFWVLALFLLGLLLVACGSSSEPDTETEPDTSAEADSGSEADMSETEFVVSLTAPPFTWKQVGKA